MQHRKFSGFFIVAKNCAILFLEIHLLKFICNKFSVQFEIEFKNLRLKFKIEEIFFNKKKMTIGEKFSKKMQKN